MSKHIYLALAIHNHQPVGNFDFVFAQAYEQAYAPMIDLLESHPTIHLALHYTGPLRDWLAENQPQFLSRIAALVARGQVEIMTGGYYEPILPVIPDADKLGQIRKLTQAVYQDFSYTPSGAWLAERVWEPHLAKALAEAGVEYTIVDDTHFKWVGLEDKDLFGYYITEEQGAMLKIFPTSKHLRYTIPWASVEEVMVYLRDEATDLGPKVAVMGDDG
ncbi:MAG: 4-alpha-glucanotransferase, partial [Anaerolineae bacterium]